MNIIEGMLSPAYHAIAAASHSRLCKMRQSPAHCRHALDHPEQTPAMAFGEAVHAAVLEPKRYSHDYTIVWGDRRTKAVKERIAQVEAAGKAAITDNDAEAIDGMQAALHAHPRAKSLLTLAGRTELSAFWHDDEFDVDCKLRADRVVEVPGFGMACVDLKTTTDASPEAFRRAMGKWGYAIQGGFYLDGLAKCGIACEAFIVIAVEKEPPHGVAVYAIGEDSLEQGRRESRRLLKRYAECVKSGKWPSYGDAIEVLDLAAWEFDEEDTFAGV